MQVVAAVTDLYSVSAATVYRALHQVNKPYAVHRADYGKPRVLQSDDSQCFCELVDALKLRTTNKQGRHLSTQRAIELLEEHGVETGDGLVGHRPASIVVCCRLLEAQWKFEVEAMPAT